MKATPRKPRQKTPSETFSPDLPPVDEPEGQTDLANAERFEKLHKDKALFCPQMGKKGEWNLYEGTHWQRGDDGAAIRLAEVVIDEIRWQANECYSESARKFANRSANVTRIKAMIELAKAKMSVTISEFDRNPWLLNCLNGTVDLRQGTLRPHCREDRITKLCPTEFHEDAQSDEWEQFLRDIFVIPPFCELHDCDVLQFVHAFLGYCLTGDVSEQVLPIFCGEGANGKSTLLNAVMATVGEDYTSQAPLDFLMTNREKHTTAQADLRGKRLISCVESGDGSRLDETLVKQLTGGDPIRARKMFTDNSQFNPTHKLVLSTNHPPTIRGTDTAIWRRLIMVPFTASFSGRRQDRKLLGKLLRQREAILAWLFCGTQLWLRDGLPMPSTIQNATASYRTDQNVVGRFLEECCIKKPGSRIKASYLYAAFEHWCRQNGEQHHTNNWFGRRMTELKYPRRPSNGNLYEGLDLLPGTI